VGTIGAILAAVAGCGGGSGGGGNGTTDFGGQTIQIWSSMDQPVIDGLSAKLAPEVKALNINVKWSKVDNINQIIVSKVQANDPPDIALLPQPGVIKDLAAKHKLTALDNILDLNALSSSMTAGTLDVAKGADGKTYGLMISMNVKGLVFYPKAAFEGAGYTAPTTIDQLNQLTDKIRSDGNTPWCLGVESGTATGWPATDWFENLVLKYGGIDQYNQWISHQVKFDSPLIRQAAAEFQNIAFTDGNVLGGRRSIDSNNFGTAGNAMFNKPKPGCFMYMQGSFITGFFPKDVQASLDTSVGVFGMPPVTAGGDNPVEGGGDTASIYKDSKAAEKVMQLLAATDIGTLAASNGSSFISPHKDFPLSNYPLKTTQAIAQVAYSATGFGFDASDAMPGVVGTGSFWKEMTAWIAGSESLDAALKNIDDSWPSQ
jgi:alpha-glucoside transport system substrate-binding protein